VIVQGLAIGCRYLAEIKDNLPVLDPCKAVGGEMMWTLLRDDNQVCVGDAVAVNQIADALKGKDAAHSATDALSDGYDVRRQRVRHISEMVNVTVRNDETLARRGWLEGHKRRHQFVAIDKAGRRTLRHDIAEDAGHCAG